MGPVRQRSRTCTITILGLLICLVGASGQVPAVGGNFAQVDCGSDPANAACRAAATTARPAVPAPIPAPTAPAVAPTGPVPPAPALNAANAAVTAPPAPAASRGPTATAASAMKAPSAWVPVQPIPSTPAPAPPSPAPLPVPSPVVVPAPAPLVVPSPVPSLVVPPASPGVVFAELSPVVAPAVKTPSPSPAQVLKPSPSPKPVQSPPLPVPVQPNSLIVPVQPYPSPAPAKPSPSPVPVQPSPLIVPVMPYPSPAPAKPSPSPVPVQPSPSPVPAKLSPSPAPAKPSPSPVPAKLSPSPAPAKPSPSPAPVKRSPSPSPAKTSPPPPARLYNAVAPSVYTQVETWVDTGNITIPQTFMGLSHEWNYIQEINDIPEYPKVIQTLTAYGGGPMIIRVGGGSTDHQTTVPGNDVWSSLAALYRSTGTRYILGLNFYNGDVGLARRQMQAALNGLPAGAIVGFELGNEPNFYTNKNGKSGNDYVRCCFNNDWRDFAYQLSCPQGESSCVIGQFIGPAWGHVNMYPTTMNWFLGNTARWVKFTTVHWYKATAEAYNTAATLLEEDPIRREAANLANLVRVSNSYGKPLRVAEMNTISNSGRWNVSNVFASALWTLDLSFEVAQAGGTGVNFHQGAGQNIYAAIVRWYSGGKLVAPILRPSFYGMLMFNMAVRGSSKLLNKKVTPYNSTSADAAKMVKIWPLQDNETGELRWVIINKHDLKGTTVRVRINRSSGYGQKASIIRLVAGGSYPLAATSGITLGGQWFGNGAAVSGRQVRDSAKVTVVKGMLQFGVYMPPGSAALVRLFRG